MSTAASISEEDGALVVSYTLSVSYSTKPVIGSFARLIILT
ncbi:hypothetical protein [Butyricicoccus pullicaecorum]